MRSSLRRYIILALTVAIFLTGSLLDVSAQSKKKKRSRRSKPAAAKPVITNPSIAPPTAATAASDDVKIISTADQTETDQNSGTIQASKAKNPSKPSSESPEMQRTINALSDQVDRLNDRLQQMQENDRYLLDMERLTRAEQRAEGLRTQLVDVQSKIADLQYRQDQIEYNLKPENIDRSTQGYGLTRPEEAREARRKQLERERANVQAQLSILESSKVRLESAIGTADAEVDLLRQKLNQTRDQKTLDETSGSPKSTNPRKPE